MVYMYFIYLSKNPAFSFTDLCYCFTSFHLLSLQDFMISFPLTLFCCCCCCCASYYSFLIIRPFVEFFLFCEVGIFFFEVDLLLHTSLLELLFTYPIYLAHLIFIVICFWLFIYLFILDFCRNALVVFEVYYLLSSTCLCFLPFSLF